jgi:hypothetical protein
MTREDQQQTLKHGATISTIMCNDERRSTTKLILVYWRYDIIISVYSKPSSAKAKIMYNEE